MVPGLDIEEKVWRITLVFLGAIIFVVVYYYYYYHFCLQYFSACSTISLFLSHFILSLFNCYFISFSLSPPFPDNLLSSHFFFYFLSFSNPSPSLSITSPRYRLTTTAIFGFSLSFLCSFPKNTCLNQSTNAIALVGNRIRRNIIFLYGRQNETRTNRSLA